MKQDELSSLIKKSLLLTMDECVNRTYQPEEIEDGFKGLKGGEIFVVSDPEDARKYKLLAKELNMNNLIICETSGSLSKLHRRLHGVTRRGIVLHSLWIEKFYIREIKKIDKTINLIRRKRV